MKLETPAIQDISRFLSEPATHPMVNASASRYHLPNLTGQMQSKEAKISHILTQANGTEAVGQFLRDLLGRIPVTPTNTRNIARAFLTSPFDVTSGPEAYMLTLRSGLSKVVEDEAAKAFLEQHAPPRTLQLLNEAQGKLGDADWDGAISDARLSLESLKEGPSLQNALAELADAGLIGRHAGTGRALVHESEFLVSTWGLLSTLGSHTAHGRREPGPDEALMAVVLAQHCCRYLVAVVVRGRGQGVALRTWFSPQRTS